MSLVKIDETKPLPVRSGGQLTKKNKKYTNETTTKVNDRVINRYITQCCCPKFAGHKIR